MGSAPHRPPIHVPTDPAVLGYLAALLDGEGNVSIGAVAGYAGQQSRSHSLMVQISNCDSGLMDWLVTTVGGATRVMPSRRPGWRACFTWTVHGENAETFLRAVQPYLIIKARQCAVALEFRSLGTGRRAGVTALDPAVVEAREGCRQRLMTLNRRGA